MSTFRIEYIGEYFRRVDEYWRQVNVSDGFDIEGIPAVKGMSDGLKICQICNSRDYLLVNHYARVGLHHYNMKEGTKFELHSLLKFNRQESSVSAYFITLVARNTIIRSSMQTFQVRIEEKRYDRLDVTCSIARRKGETTNNGPFIPYDDGAVDDGLPDWPSDDDFNDGQRFYLVRGGKLLDTYWIRMYLELAVYTHDRHISDRNLCKLNIVRVVMETSNGDVEPPNERLNAKNATVYITFKGLAIGGIGEDVERKASIKREVNESTGYFSLKSDLCSREEDGSD